MTVIKPVSLACWEDRTQRLVHCKALGTWEPSLVFYTLFPPKFLLMGNL